MDSAESVPLAKLLASRLSSVSTASSANMKNLIGSSTVWLGGPDLPATPRGSYGRVIVYIPSTSSVEARCTERFFEVRVQI